MKRVTFAFLITLLTIAQTPILVMAQTSEGYALLQKGWVNDAITAFQAALKKNPQDLRARSGLAQSFLKAGQLDDAWRQYQTLIKADGKNLEALQAIGKLGEYRAAWQLDGIAALNQLLKLTPDDRNALAQRALLLGYQGDFGPALADYERLLNARVTSPEVLLGAAKINTYAGNYGTARKLFEQAKPGGNGLDDYSLAAYGTALTQTGNASDAIVRLSDRLKTSKLEANAETDLRKALAIALAVTGNIESGLKVLDAAPGNPQAIAQGYAEIARRTGRSDLYDSAISRYRSLLKSSPSTGLTIEAADVMSEKMSEEMSEEMRSQREALNLYDSVASQLDSNHPVQFKRLMLGYRLGDRSVAEVEQFLGDRLNDSQGSKRSRRTVAQALIAIDPPEAKLLKIYQMLASDETPFLYYRVAQIHAQAQNFDLAQTALKTYQATPQGSKDIAPDLLLATIDQLSGQLDQSAETFTAIVNKTDRLDIQKSALRGLAGVRVQQRQFDQALVAYDRILAIDPQDAPAKLGLARLAVVGRKITVAEAKSVLDQWLADHPNGTPPSELFDLAGALPADDNMVKLYDRLLQINPNNVDLQRRSLQLLAIQNPSLARTQLAAYMDRAKGDVNAYYLQGEVARTLGDLDLAALAYQSILAKQPDNVDAMTALGGVRFEQKNYLEAGRIYNQVIALKPNDWNLRRTIADLSLAQDMPLKALEQLKIVQALQRQQGIKDEVTDYNIMAIEVEKLKRRSFQPAWEGYTPSK
jgi:cellulose synthase operon protein C